MKSKKLFQLLEKAFNAGGDYKMKPLSTDLMDKDCPNFIEWISKIGIGEMIVMTPSELEEFLNEYNKLIASNRYTAFIGWSQESYQNVAKINSQALKDISTQHLKSIGIFKN